jgi:hypothetical protein
MWIIKIIVAIFCVLLCLIGAVLWIIPMILMWTVQPFDAYFSGVWAVYNDLFKDYDNAKRRNTTVD